MDLPPFNYCLLDGIKHGDDLVAADRVATLVAVAIAAKRHAVDPGRPEGDLWKLVVEYQAGVGDVAADAVVVVDAACPENQSVGRRTEERAVEQPQHLLIAGDGAPHDRVRELL